MKEMESQALQYLANIQDDQFNPHLFQPYKSILFEKKNNNNIKIVVKRPLTVQNKKNRYLQGSFETRREALKNQLRILEEPIINEQNQQIKVAKKRPVTTSSTFLPKPISFNTHQNLFPTQPIKKLNPNKKTPNYFMKQNQLKIEDLVRRDIKNKFSIRQTLRQGHRTKKLQNLMNFTCQLRKTSSNKNQNNRQQIKPTRKNNLIDLLS